MFKVLGFQHLWFLVSKTKQKYLLCSVLFFPRVLTIFITVLSLKYLEQCSQLGVRLTPREHLVLSRNVFGCNSWERETERICWRLICRDSGAEVDNFDLGKQAL